MNDIFQLYQKTILDHQKYPRNFGRLENPTHEAVKDNPICGDQVHVDLNMTDNQVNDIKFRGRGCAISIASASIMTEVVQKKNLEEIQAIYSELKVLVDPKKKLEESDTIDIPSLRIFEGVRRFPSRIKCATLGWEALLEAANDQRIS